MKHEKSYARMWLDVAGALALVLVLMGLVIVSAQ